jgi:hypothetical protein
MTISLLQFTHVVLPARYIYHRFSQIIAVNCNSETSDNNTNTAAELPGQIRFPHSYAQSRPRQVYVVTNQNIQQRLVKSACSCSNKVELAKDYFTISKSRMKF